MAIEFRCTQCGRLLRTGDDTAGKPAQCPECSSIMTVPVPGAQVSSSPGGASASPVNPGVPPSGGSENPYQSPGHYGPAPGYAGTGGVGLAASRVQGPATALIVTAGLAIALQVMGIVANLLQIGMAPAGMMHRHELVPVFLSGGVAVGINAVGIIIGVVVILGAMKMKNLENYAFAMTAAIIAMIPCISPCCVLGLPFGIWALVVLSDPSVKAAFRS